MAERNRAKKKNTEAKIWIFAVAAILALAIALVAVLPQFFIEDIQISGNYYVSDKDILAASAINKGEHLLAHVSGGLGRSLSFRYGDIEDELKAKYPYIDTVSVRAEYPYTVKIEVKEKIPVVYIYCQEKYAAIDRNGEIIGLSTAKPDTRAAIVTGIELSNCAVGENISADTMRQINRVLLVMNYILDADKNSQDDFSLINCIAEFRPYQANTLYMRIKPEALKKENNSKDSKSENSPESGTTNSEGKDENTDAADNSGQTAAGSAEPKATENKNTDHKKEQELGFYVKLNPSQNTQESISWLRYVLQAGMLDDLGNGVLNLSTEQKVFSKKEQLPAPIKEEPDIRPDETKAGNLPEISQNIPSSSPTGEETTSNTSEDSKTSA